MTCLLMHMPLAISYILFSFRSLKFSLLNMNMGTFHNVTHPVFKY